MMSRFVPFAICFATRCRSGMSNLCSFGATTCRTLSARADSAEMCIFSAGYIAVSYVFQLLFLRALKMRVKLDLNPLEVFETRVSVGTSGVNLAVRAVSLMPALSGRGDLAGII